MTPETLISYLDKVTSEHRDREKFIATVTALLQPVIDVSLLQSLFTEDFDLDTAVGAQLDIVGLWAGISRYLETPLEGVYFSFDTEGLGWDEGYWLGPYDPTTGLTILPDDAYRLLIRAKIARNQWDGTLPGAYAAYDILFADSGFTVIIQNAVPSFSSDFFSFDDALRGWDSDAGWYGPGTGVLTMKIILGLLGPVPDAVTLALFTGSYLSLKPAGVQIEYFATQNTLDTPFFGFDSDTDAVAGFDVGAWATLTPP